MADGALRGHPLPVLVNMGGRVKYERAIVRRSIRRRSNCQQLAL